ncbi:PEP-CTERM protein-sorting domain-containing protein [Desulfonema limicola]|uniref:PEP-CTERM protein-sorting domain-containing protein n=1 Tax=Desulfonema limicola TaxID=45656 RepID=A0A975B9N3_9BACT|nr:PEP-CTERM sorting domain-containing protein [Desulfonema limicola]QTA81125.1 PEP-CTERM protein-sorting domain-containing protein [Desulfonema limicola]
MKKLLILLGIVILVCGIAGNGTAASYYFEDMIDDWEVNGVTYGSVYIDQDPDLSNLVMPNTVSAPFSYTHDISDVVDLAGGDTVLEAWLELDFVNMDGPLGLEGDSYGKSWIFGWYDNREFVQYTFDAGISSWIEIDTDNDIQTSVLSIDWLNDDGLLDVTISLANITNDADIGLDHSRLYGNAVPEPATIILLGSGILGLAGYKRKRFNKKS